MIGLYTEGYEYSAKARTKKDAKVYVAFKVLDDLGCAEDCEGYEGKGNLILSFRLPASTGLSMAKCHKVNQYLNKFLF